MTFKRTAISLGLGLIVLAIGFTFFNKKSVDDGELEKQLTAQILDHKNLADSDVSVSCPTSEEQKKGTTFDCKATIDGSEHTLHVTIVDDDGNYVVPLPKAIRSAPKAKPAGKS